MGKIIVFEGLDCSFKETNSKALAEYLENELGLKAKLFSFPVYKNDSSFFVREYLKGSYGSDPALINGDLASTFYMMDQFHIWKTQIQRYYEQDYAIILDRFWTSCLVLQACKPYRVTGGRAPETTTIQKINEHIRNITNMATDLFNLPNPDIILKMTMHFENIVDLLKEKNSDNDIHENRLDFLQNIHAAYNDERILFNRAKTFIPIKCSEGHIDLSKKGIVLSKESIFNRVKEVVIPELKGVAKK